MILDSLLALPGLMPGGYRGISFEVPDTRTETGRAVAEHFFPGLDHAAYDDLHLLPEVVSIEGLIVGDDYIARAKALRSAFQTPGPGLLIHPWLGPMQVIVDHPIEISFSARELRVARFFAYFKRLSIASPARLSTAAILLSAAADLASVAVALIVAADAVTLSRVRGAAATRSGRLFAAAVSDAVAASSAASPIASALPETVPATPSAFADVVTAVSGAIETAVPALTAPSAVAPAYSATAEPGIEPLAAFAIVLDLAGRLTSAVAHAPSATDQAMLAGAAATILSEIGVLLGQAAFATQDEAIGTRSAIASAVDALASGIVTLSTSLFAGAASNVERSLSDLRAAALSDINEVVGRLPQVVAVTTDRPADAFDVAHHLFGDTPGRVEAAYADIVARNQPRHPARLPTGHVEAAV